MPSPSSLHSWNLHISAFTKHLRAAGRPDTTIGLRRYHLTRFAKDHSDTQLRHITCEQVTAWFAVHDWAPQTRRNYRSSLRLFFAWCLATQRRASDPTANLPTVALPRSLPRPAPEGIVRSALLSPSTTDPRVKLAIFILANTGMRRAEVAGLHTDDVEHTPDGAQLRVIGKGGHERVVPISDELAAHLDSLPSGPVFPGRIDGHLSPAYLGKLVSRALGEGWTAHTLRHRFASEAYKVDRDIRAVQELLGHASVRTTQIYTALPTDSLRKAAVGALVPFDLGRAA